MSSKKRICLVGEIIIDLTLNPVRKLRIGGVMHAARGLWAADTTYDLLYIAPAYLHEQIKKYGMHHGAQHIICIGEVIGAPNLILIDEPKEVGSQRYDLLLSEEHKTNYVLENATLHIERNDYSDVIFFSGQYDFCTVVNIFKASNARLHADIANNFEDTDVLDQLSIKFSTLITSTSSILFQQFFNASTELLKETLLSTYCYNLLFKQNRGGSSLYLSSGKSLTIGAQLRKISHSIGVGDCFSAIYVSMNDNNEEVALAYASWIAAEYATTSFPDDFKQLVHNIKQLKIDFLISASSIFLPWDIRKKINIYIAGPDFDFNDTTIIDNIFNSLQYHNFSPRRPIRENGQMEAKASLNRRQELYEKDLAILYDCQLIIAVLTENDPGTLVEIGIASAMNIPVLLYDPFRMANNCMLTQSCYAVINEMDDLIDQVFVLSAKNNDIN